MISRQCCITIKIRKYMWNQDGQLTKLGQTTAGI